MNIQKDIKNQIKDFQSIDDNTLDLENKLDEFIHLLSLSNLDSEKAKQVKDKLNNAMESALSNREKIKAYEALDENPNLSRENLLDNIGILLSQHELNSDNARTYIWQERIKKFVVGIISVVLISLGFAMIIMPAPPYFEMFTIFHFTVDDGVTLMDLISLLIVLSGVYLLIKSMFIKQGSEY